MKRLIISLSIFAFLLTFVTPLNVMAKSEPVQDGVIYKNPPKDSAGKYLTFYTEDGWLYAENDSGDVTESLCYLTSRSVTLENKTILLVWTSDGRKEINLNNFYPNTSKMPTSSSFKDIDSSSHSNSDYESSYPSERDESSHSSIEENFLYKHTFEDDTSIEFFSEDYKLYARFLNSRGKTVKTTSRLMNLSTTQYKVTYYEEEKRINFIDSNKNIRYLSLDSYSSSNRSLDSSDFTLIDRGFKFSSFKKELDHDTNTLKIYAYSKNAQYKIYLGNEYPNDISDRRPRESDGFKSVCKVDNVTIWVRNNQLYWVQQDRNWSLISKMYDQMNGKCYAYFSDGGITYLYFADSYGKYNRFYFDSKTFSRVDHSGTATTIYTTDSQVCLGTTEGDIKAK